MSRSQVGRLATLLVSAVLALTGGQLVGGPATAAPSPLQVRTVCYNASNAPSFSGIASQAASIWNGSVSAVRLSACGSSVMIYQTTGGGSYAVVYGLGSGYVVIDTRQAQQYSPLRIMTHELGHILGLPDNYNGDCNLLMSGGSAGTGCTNPYPSAGEAARVNANFGGRSGGSAADDWSGVFRDSWPAPDRSAA